MSEIAAILVRSLIGAAPDIRKSCENLRLVRKNSCVIIKDTPSNRGMLKRAKDYITWGNLDEEGKKALEKKKSGGKAFRLSPPKKGYGRKGIKVPFGVGGALGERKEKINDLIKRMV